MHKYLIPVILSISFSSNSQEEETRKLVRKDSLQEVYMMKTISEDNLEALNICENLWYCKGFYTEKDTSQTSIREMDIRAIISKVSDFEFKIEYKFRDSKQFIVDTFNLFCIHNTFCQAFPLNFKVDFSSHGISLPSSTDERDIVFIVTKKEEILLYQKK